NNSWDWFYGETMSGGEKNMLMLMLGYQHKDISVNVGIMNPFTDNYKQDSENRSQYASYKKSNYINESSRMVVLQFSYNFSFGRAFNSQQKMLNNADDDSGVMKTEK
ncbi:MAG: TonB-dependent receptor, partial [Prevotellaceae bacterium]|nr:TonB-dependent receptor [Prevotellaceae bacterium]